MIAINIFKTINHEHDNVEGDDVYEMIVSIFNNDMT